MIIGLEAQFLVFLRVAVLHSFTVKNILHDKGYFIYILLILNLFLFFTE